MSIENVKNYLKKYNLEDRVLEFSESTATVEDAARAVGCEGKQIAKTMSFDVNGQTILVVLAGDTKVDNSKYKKTFGVKAKMLSFDEVEDRVGHRAGGVGPFNVKSDVKVYLDEGLKRFDYVYPAAGTDHSAVKLTIPELEKSSQYVSYVDVAKLKE